MCVCVCVCVFGCLRFTDIRLCRLFNAKSILYT